MKPIFILTFLLVVFLAIDARNSAQAESMSSIYKYVPADEALYMKRWTEAKASGSQRDYEPVEPLKGARDTKPLPAAPPGERSVTAKALAAARAYASQNNSDALLVWRKGRLQAAYYFRGTKPESLINTFSLSKPLASIAVGRAIELGLIRSLDQSVSDFIGEWKGTPKAAIKVRHLLDMRAGFGVDTVAAGADDMASRAYLHPRHDDVLINDYPLAAEPGARFEYTNAPYDLVAILIERASGRRYAEFVSTEILKPLGAEGGQILLDRPGGAAHAGFGSFLPSQTILRLGLLLLQDGRWEGRQLLQPRYVEAMLAPTAQNPYFGLGVFVQGKYTPRRGFANPDRNLPATLHGEPYLAKDLFLFDGNHNQVLYIVPSADLAILRVGDTPPRTPEWDNSVLPNLILRGLDDPRVGTDTDKADIGLSMVRRTTVAATDPEASLRFYRDLLGFKVEYDLDVTDSPQLTVFAPGATKGRAIALRRGERMGGAIGLFHAAGMKPSSTCTAAAAGGAMAILLLTDDLDSLFRRLKAASVPFLVEPYSYDNGRGKGPIGTFTVFDPDCVRVTFAQIGRETLDQSERR